MLKKISIVLFSLSHCALAAADIRVISPNGGESWILRQAYVITWEATGVSEAVKLVLFQGTRRVGIIAQGLGASPGNHSWRAGELLNGTAAAGGNYKVRVTNEGGTLWDASNAAFTLAEPTLRSKPPEAHGTPNVIPSTITLLEPNGGETFAFGDTMRVRWQSTGAIDRVTIRLDRETPTVFTKAVAGGSDDGVEEFPIPSTFRQGGTFRARVFGHTAPDAWVEDASDHAFTISRALELSLWRKEIAILYRREGSDAWDVILAALAPFTSSVDAYYYGRCKEKKLKVTFRVKNESNSWPHSPLNVFWRVRIERQEPFEIFATQEGTVPLSATQPGLDQIVTINLGKDTWGVFKCIIEIDPDHSLPIPDSLRRSHVSSGLFLVKRCKN